IRVCYQVRCFTRSRSSLHSRHKKRVDTTIYPSFANLYITRIITLTAYTARFTSQKASTVPINNVPAAGTPSAVQVGQPLIVGCSPAFSAATVAFACVRATGGALTATGGA